jgi:hypothetical protein
MRVTAGVFIVLVVGMASRARAVEPEFAISLGYSHVSLADTSVGEFGEQGGFRFEPRFSFAPSADRPQFRVGIGMGFSFFYDETDGSAAFIDDDGDIIIADADDYEQLFFWTPELQLSWRQRWENGWMLEGGVGLGGVFAYIRRGRAVLRRVLRYRARGGRHHLLHSPFPPHRLPRRRADGRP